MKNYINFRLTKHKMSIPLTLPEQKKQNWFRPDSQVGLYIGYSEYAQVTIKQNAKSKAKLIEFESLAWVKDNVNKFKKCMKKYMIRDATCLIDEDSKSVEAKINEVSKKIL